MPSLRFEDLPSDISIGETYNVAIILENDEGEPMSEAEGVKVKVDVEAPHSEFQDAVENWFKKEKGVTGIQDNIEISFGEGIIELVFHKPAPGNQLILRASIVSGPSSNDAEGELTSVPCASTAADKQEETADEELSDLSLIIARLRTSMNASTAENVGPKVKHYLMLIKGRMWNAEGNSKRMLDSGLVKMLLELVETAPKSGGASVEAVLEGLNVLEELLINTTAQVISSCSSCRALIRPDNTMEILSTGKMGVFHASCLRCRTCNNSVHTEKFIRDKPKLHPHHLECAVKANVERADPNEVLTCSVLPSVSGDASHHVAAADFWNAETKQVEMLCSSLEKKWLADNEYVRDRCKRVGLHVSKSNSGPLARREKFVTFMVGNKKFGEIFA
jgi:hypothetical protein